MSRIEMMVTHERTVSIADDIIHGLAEILL